MTLAQPVPTLSPAYRSTSGLPTTVIAFLICLALPVVFHAGGLRLSPYRLVLLAAFLPFVLRWLSGDAGRVRPPDLIVLAIAVWSAFSFIVVHGTTGIEAAGIVFIETFVPYLIARVCIRDLAGFKAMVQLLFRIILVLLPFAMIETLTSENLLNAIVDIALQTYPDVEKPPRLGLDRVQGPFEHPILFGVFCGSAFALVFYTLRQSMRLRRAGVVFVTAGLSLSSGPLSALIAQFGLLIWDRLMVSLPNRWGVLAALSIVAYVVVDLLSNRTPAEVFISYAAFNSETAYNRLLIWEWTWVNVWDHPWFGLGNGEWKRLWFMTPSVDMFWMQRTMVHGLPVGLLNIALLLWLVIAVALRGDLAPETAECRKGLIISLASLFIAGMTVHFWNATFVWYMFLLGSTVWILNAPERRAFASETDDGDTPKVLTPCGLMA
ncbi:MAG: O-antigen ligase family protein [Pseudomonadota bacterium]